MALYNYLSQNKLSHEEEVKHHSIVDARLLQMTHLLLCNRNWYVYRRLCDDEYALKSWASTKGCTCHVRDVR